MDNHQPKVVFISLGINNVYDTDSTGDNKPSNVTYQEIADEVKTTMEKLEDYGVIPIWMGVLSNRDGQTEADAINHAVEIYCAANGWTCGSSLDQMRLNSNWQTDYYDNNGLGGLSSNLHPDKDGHDLMARLAQSLYIEAMNNAATSVSSSSTSSDSVPGIPTGVSCNNTRPGGAPDLFQIDRFGKSARLYFAPAREPYNQYIVTYGINDRTEQFGVRFDIGHSTGVIDYTIGALEPNTAYSFKVQAGNGCAPGEWSNVLTTGPLTSIKQSFYRVGGSSGNKMGTGLSPFTPTGTIAATPSVAMTKTKDLPKSPQSPSRASHTPQEPAAQYQHSSGFWQWFLSLFGRS